MELEIWSDLVCPWCYIGKRRFERALERFEQRDHVTVTWRSFELDPRAPNAKDAAHETSVAEILAEKYGGGIERANAMIENVTGIAAEEGLEYRLDIARRSNTFDAHRLTHFAAERELQKPMVERLMRGYFSDGEPIGDHETLVRAAGDVGLDLGEAAAMLAGDDYMDAVRSDERTAAQLGIQGVPCFVFDRRTGLSGAQPAEVLLKAMQDAWQTVNA